MRDFAQRFADFDAVELQDEDGRPVAEIASPLYRQIPTELAACPYADSRAGEPMNRSALRQVAAVWPEVLCCFAALVGPEPTAHQAWCAALTGVGLPLVGPTPTPRVLSALFKASLGFSQILTALLLSDDGVADLHLHELGDGKSFFAELDRGRWLHGVEQVCAGTQPMMIGAFDALSGAAIPRAPTVPRRSTPASLAEPASLASLAPQVATAPTVVGLQLIHWCARNHAASLGDGSAIRSVPPWLRSAAAIPDRPPYHVLRLFPHECAPTPILALLEQVGSAAEADDAYGRQLSALALPPPV